MNNIEFIYFDVGGVLLDWSNTLPIIAEKLNVPFDKLNYKEVDDIACRGDVASNEIWNLYQKYNNSNAELAGNFPEFLVSTFKPIIPMHELIVKLKEQGFKLGLLTNIYPDVYDLLIKNKLIPNINYDVVIKSSQIHLIKPQEEIFRLAEVSANTKAENILFLDDTDININVANELGWNAIKIHSEDIEDGINIIYKTLRMPL